MLVRELAPSLQDRAAAWKGRSSQSHRGHSGRKAAHSTMTSREAAGAGMICGGVLDIYIEPIIPTPTVFIFGGGHISLFVSKISAMAGFQVAVIDDRAEFASTERFPEAEQVIAEKFSQVFPQLKVNRSVIWSSLRGDMPATRRPGWALYGGQVHRRSAAKVEPLSEPGKKASPGTCNASLRPSARIGRRRIAVSIVGQMIQVRRLVYPRNVWSVSVVVAQEVKRMGRPSSSYEEDSAAARSGIAYQLRCGRGHSGAGA
jgi:hypothetical protein